MKEITLVSCCREKLSRMAPARELYRSQLFRKSAQWADKQGNDWFVISAKYGLIKPDNRLMPYDQTMRAMSPFDRQYWAHAIANEIAALASFYDVEHLSVVLMAGADYANWIPLTENLCTVRQPLAGLQIGQRLKWLNDQMAEQQGDQS